MPMIRPVLFLLLILVLLPGSGADEVLLNGTSIQLVTGDSYGLYQGYVLILKSVSGDGSIWLQLTEKEELVKSEIVTDNGYFIYNKSNTTILSVKIEGVYSGSSEQNLVSLFPVYQYMDPDMPAPDTTGILPDRTLNPGNNLGVKIHTPGEPLIWALGIIFTLILFYSVRKLW